MKSQPARVVRAWRGQDDETLIVIEETFDTREAADRYLKDLERTTGARGFVASAN